MMPCENAWICLIVIYVTAAAVVLCIICIYAYLCVKFTFGMILNQKFDFVAFRSSARSLSY